MANWPAKPARLQGTDHRLPSVWPLGPATKRNSVQDASRCRAQVCLPGNNARNTRVSNLTDWRHIGIAWAIIVPVILASIACLNGTLPPRAIAQQTTAWEALLIHATTPLRSTRKTWRQTGSEHRRAALRRSSGAVPFDVLHKRPHRVAGNPCPRATGFQENLDRPAHWGRCSHVCGPRWCLETERVLSPSK